MVTLTNTYTNLKLQPKYRAEDAHEIVVKLSDGTYAKGTILAESATPGTFGAYAYAEAAAPSVAPVPSEGAAGALAAGDYYVTYTLTKNGLETVGAVPVAVTLGASKRLNIASVAIPAGYDGINWYISDDENSLVLRYISRQTTAGAQVLNALPATNAKMVPTTSTVRGTLGQAKAILPYACVVSSGAITGIREWSDLTNIPVYVSGWFDTADLTGLDDAAMNDLNASLISGSLTSGVIRF